MRYTYLPCARLCYEGNVGGGGGGGGLRSSELYNIFRVCWATKQKVEIKKCKFVRSLKGAIPTIFMGAILIE